LLGAGYETKSVGNNTVPGATAGLSLYFQKSRDPTQAPITHVSFVTGDEAQLPAPEGLTLLAGGTSLGSGPNVADVAADGGAAEEVARTEARAAALTALLDVNGNGGAAVNNGLLAELVWESDDVRSSLENVHIDPSAVRAYLEANVDGTSRYVFGHCRLRITLLGLLRSQVLCLHAHLSPVFSRILPFSVFFFSSLLLFFSLLSSF
jgi:hypothetical protein